MSKTIKQIADEIGVSKQAVQKRLSRKPLCTSVQPYISTIGGTKYIEVVGENLIKSAFLYNDRQQVVDNLSIDKNNQCSTDFQPVIDVLQATIDTLQSQLEVKDQQIEKLQQELAEERKHSREQTEKFSILADQAQRLQLAQIASSSEQSPLVEDSKSVKLHWWQRKKVIK